jgi:hypothetical protein
LKENKLPELFSLAQHDLGSRNDLVDVVRVALAPSAKRTGTLYEHLVRWPFACYLTTNFDDELPDRLRAAGIPFQTLGNRVEDFHALRDGASGLILKIHSDLAHPRDAVLTSADFQRLEASSEGQYFRDRLRAVFETFDILVFGHSLKDPDIGLILRTARETASPEHPVYLVMADLTAAEQRELRLTHNVRAITYNNSDGTHAELKRIVRVADKFIASRAQFVSPRKIIQSADDSEAAVSLLIFRRLQAAQSKERTAPAQTYAPAVLTALAKHPGGATSSEVQITAPVDVLATSDAARQVIDEALELLRNERLAVYSGPESKYRITERGQDRLAEVRTLRELEERQAYDDFIANLQNRKPDLTSAETADCTSRIRSALVKVFRERGLTIANSIYSNRSVVPSEYANVFKALTSSSADILDGDLKASFLEAARDFIVEPSDHQKRYLESISQGYFLYHLAGLDPKGTKVRRDMLEDSAWLMDSSVLLPWVAVGSHSHEYATDLFMRYRALGASLLTTERLLQETWEHLQWAIRLVRQHPVTTAGFLDSAVMRDGGRQNLFVDGYIRLAAEGRVGTFDDYLALVAPRGVSRALLDQEISKRGITVVEMTALDGFDASDWGELPEIEAEIQKAREAKGTYRHEGQVKAEAEVLHLLRALREGRYFLPGKKKTPSTTYFASQSRILDRILSEGTVTTWTPEAMYRYVTALPGESTDPELLQKCMLSEYFFSGISFIDRKRYEEFFGPMIRESLVVFAEQKEHYLREVEADAELDDAFDRTSNLEKPLFVSQIATRVANAAVQRANALAARASEAERKVDKLESEKAAGWKRKLEERERQEAARARNAADPALQRKKARQAKKRRRRKK